MIRKGWVAATKAILFIVLILAFLSVVTAQNILPPHEKVDIKTKDTSVLVTIKLVLPDGDHIHATQSVGELIRVKKGRFLFLITPKVDSTGSVFIESNTVEEYKVVNPTQSFGLQLNPKAYKPLSGASRLELPFIVRIERIQNLTTENHIPLRQLDSQGINAGTCCVTCKGITTCACAVSANCGSCCVGRCC